MSALVGNMARKDFFFCFCLFFFFFPRVCVHNHPFHWYRSIFRKWSLASWLSWAVFHKRAKGDSSLKKQACAAIEERCWYLIFTFSFSLPEKFFVYFSVTKEDCTECSVCDLTIIILFNCQLFIDRCRTCLFFLSERIFNCSKRSFSVKHLGTSELSITCLLHCQH